MSNMSYCRFRNTLGDLRDCYYNMDDDDLSEDESIAKISLLELCNEIANEYTDII